MKTSIISFIKIILLLIVNAACKATPMSDEKPDEGNEVEKPNFILILTDDQGWTDVSYQSDPNYLHSKSDYYETPVMERMAEQGMRFTQGYAPSPYCCPTRRSLLVGQSPARHIKHRDQPEVIAGIPMDAERARQQGKDFSSGWLRKYREQLTIPQMLKAADSSYRTAHFGKWDFRYDFPMPDEFGYDAHDKFYTTNHDAFMWRDDIRDIPWRQSKDPKLMFTVTHNSIEFMREQVSMNHPFFLQVSHYGVHLDVQSTLETYEKYLAKPRGTKHDQPGFAAMLHDLDTSIGQLLKTVDELGIGDNTYIFFMSDNGGRAWLADRDIRNNNHPLKDGKGSLWEGGIRVPFIVLGPNITPGTISDVPVTGLDLFPTIADLAGYKDILPESLDGGSMVNVLFNAGKGKVERNIPFLIWHQSVKRPSQSALRQGDYKLYRVGDVGDERILLFDLSKDISESKNLAAQHPEKVDTLYQLMINYLQDVGAEMNKTR